MSKFKAGDKVRCIDSSASGNSLKYGGIYTISHIECPLRDEVYLDDSKPSWIQSRFELVNETPSNQHIKDVGNQLVGVIKDHYSKERVMPIIGEKTIYQEYKENPKLDTNSGGTKHDSSKPPMDLIPYEALEEIAKVLAEGEKKYSTANWTKGIEMRRLLSAAMRHLGQFNSGEDFDKETNTLHIANAATNLLFAIWMYKHRPDLDNRWAKKNKQEVLTDEEKLEAAIEFQARGR